MSDTFKPNDPAHLDRIPNQYPYMVNPLKDPQWETYDEPLKFALLSQAVLLGHEVYQNAMEEVDTLTSKLAELAEAIVNRHESGVESPSERKSIRTLQEEFLQVRVRIAEAKRSANAAYDAFHPLVEKSLKIATDNGFQDPST